MTHALGIRRVLVTGASGKIGRHLVPALVKAGFAVRAVENRTPVRASGVEIVRGSVSDYDFVARALTDCDAVCHLASTKEDKPGFLDVSVRGTWNLLDAARESGRIRQFLISSGDAAMGIFYYPNPAPIREDMPLRAYPGVYALSKVLEDTLVIQHGIQYALPCTILRISWVFDEDDILQHLTLQPPDFGSPWRSLATSDAQRKFFEKTGTVPPVKMGTVPPVGAASGTVPIFSRDAIGCLRHPDGRAFKRHIVGVADVVQAFMLALGNERALGETFHIAGPAPFLYDALAEYAGRKLGLPVVDFTHPTAYDFEIDIAKARAVLGYKPTFTAERIVDAAIAFRKSGPR